VSHAGQSTHTSGGDNQAVRRSWEGHHANLQQCSKFQAQVVGPVFEGNVIGVGPNSRVWHACGRPSLFSLECIDADKASRPVLVHVNDELVLQQFPLALCECPVRVALSVLVYTVLGYFATVVVELCCGFPAHQSQDHGVEYKGDDSPLTKADTESNRIICEGLQRLTPHVPIISEETKAMPYSIRQVAGSQSSLTS